VTWDGGIDIGGVEEHPWSKTKKGEKTSAMANDLNLKSFLMWVIMYAGTDKWGFPNTGKDSSWGYAYTYCLPDQSPHAHFGGDIVICGWFAGHSHS
jgi:hypothetical protein